MEKVIASGSHSMPTTPPSRGIDVAMLQTTRRVLDLLTKQEETSRAVEKLMSSSVDKELRIQLYLNKPHIMAYWCGRLMK